MASANIHVVNGSINLFDRLGGEIALTKVIDNLYELILDESNASNIQVRKLFSSVTNWTHQKKMMHRYMEAVLGGRPYNGRSMRNAHAKLNITEQDFDKIIDLLVTSLQNNGVSAILISEVVQVAEGTRDDVLGRGAPSAASRKQSTTSV